MSAYYFDSSAWVKHYVPEPGSPAVDALPAGPGPHFAARLGVVELHAAFAKNVRMGKLSDAGFAANLQRLRSDLVARRIGVVQMARGHHATADRLIDAVGLRHNLRSLDALQLAVALRLRAVHPGLVFVSADQALLATAAGQGLAVGHV